MRKRTFTTCLLTLVLLFASPVVSHTGTLSEEVCDRLGRTVKGMEAASDMEGRAGMPAVSRPVSEFYEAREFRPAWSDDYGLSPIAFDLLSAIRMASREGLNPDDYNPGRIETMLSELGSGNIAGTFEAEQLAELDVILTETFFLYATHIHDGRVDHVNIYPDWVVTSKTTDLPGILSDAVESQDMQEALAGLVPRYQGYAALRKELMAYQAVAERGGWPRIPPGVKMVKGSRSTRIVALRERLSISGDLALLASGNPDFFDRDLEVAVKTFQKRHGLKDDGRAGKSTLQALNVPVETRIRQIALNMDRLRWLSDDMGQDHIFVNVADFSLEVVEDGSPVMAMRIIAGKDEQRSCVLSAKMTYLELNPFWRVPDSIAAKEILPEVKKDPGYLAKKNIKVFKDWSDNAKEIDPTKVKWSRVSAANLTHKFRQEPGLLNPLGRIKFIFPNECEIYLHDTPARHLFVKARRDLSHGCIRVERPVELAAYLLRNKETWTQKKIVAEINKGKRLVVMLPLPVDVHVFYGTAWVDRKGVLQFRDDIYHADGIPYNIPVGTDMVKRNE